ncbi:MAG: hypothetical protein HC769_15900 [Cyanobacteria bacterium CRU_2_1]|nr:hypothetical protein [Cyanobacteria bacterium RU_5_0]NJR60182.1 hypothetical protein [Cyanobacteria bacterium CRU_2_1]
MRSNNYASKLQSDDIGGTFATNLVTTPESSAIALDTEFDFEADLYKPMPTLPLKKHSTQFLNTKLKAKQIGEERLIRLSAELSKLADEIRYLNPLIAEVLDEAWDATQDAIEMLSDDKAW